MNIKYFIHDFYPMEDKQFNLTTLDEIQKKVDKMPFQLVLFCCALCIITFFIIMLMVQLDMKEKLGKIKEAQSTINTSQEELKEVIGNILDIK